MGKLERYSAHNKVRKVDIVENSFFFIYMGIIKMCFFLKNLFMFRIKMGCEKNVYF